MVPSPKFELIQERLGASLAEQLRIWRAAGVSAPAVARLLAHHTGVVVADETIRRWYAALDEAA